MKPNESKGYQNCWTGRALRSHLHPQHHGAGGASCSLLAAPHPTEVPGTLRRVFCGAWDSSGGEGEGNGKRRNEAQALGDCSGSLCSNCHSEAGLSQRFCWPELSAWSMKEFWSIWAISVHSNRGAVNDPGPQEMS